MSASTQEHRCVHVHTPCPHREEREGKHRSTDVHVHTPRLRREEREGEEAGKEEER